MKYFEWRGENISQFVLGAAQLGMNYGIANQTGQPNKKEAFGILDEVIKNGVTMIDTAQAYGNSEEIIAQWLEKNNKKKHQINIMSKWDANVDIKNKEQLKVSAQISAKTLGVTLWGMMIHDEMNLNQLDAIYQASKELKKEGVFKYLGASVYSVGAAKKAIETSQIDFIQVPCNAWDNRMIESGIFELAQKNNTLCFVRSIFLQGVLIMSKEEICNKLPKLSRAYEIWEAASNRYKVFKRKLAIEFAKQLNCPIVLGIEKQSQASDNIDLLKTDLLNINFKQINKDVSRGSMNFDLDPRNWNVGK